jgi:hypothetical protein
VETTRTLVTLGKCLLATVPAVGAVLGLRAVVDLGGIGGAWLDLVLTTVVVGVVMSAVLLAVRTPELTAAVRPILTRFTRRRPPE